MFKSATFYKKQMKDLDNEPEFLRTKNMRYEKSSDFELNKKYQKELEDVKKELNNNKHLSNQQKKKQLRALENNEYYDSENVREVDDYFKNMFSAKRRASKKSRASRIKRSYRKKSRASKRRASKRR